MTLVSFAVVINFILWFLLLFLGPRSVSQINFLSSNTVASLQSIKNEANKRETQTGADVFHANVTRGGIVFDLQIQPLQTRRAATSLQQNHSLRFRLSLRDSETGNALTGLHPSAWMNPIQGDNNVPCKTMVQSFLRGSLLAKRPEVDLNTYYVATLNETASITVADPQFMAGRPRQVARIALKGRGEDWALSSNESLLYVSLPEANEVDMIDTASWEIVRRKELPRPGRVMLQPDEHYLWAGYGGTNQPSGVAALEATTLTEVARFPTGPGPHDIAFSPDSRVAFVTTRNQGSVVTIDVPHLALIQEIKTHGHPVSVAFSTLADAAYITDTKLGNIFAIRPGGHDDAPAALIPAEPGITRISFPGNGRFGVVLNPEKGLIHIVDTARNQIVQTAGIDKSPTQVFFSEQLAYIILQKSDLIEMLPLEQIGRPGMALPVVDLPGGPSSGTGGPASDERTAAIAQVPGQNAVVIASRPDRAVYYYDEGMAAPMGTFSNFGEGPKALLVIDRSFRETSPGTYEAVASINNIGNGAYILPVVLDNPQMVECFQVPIVK